MFRAISRSWKLLSVSEKGKLKFLTFLRVIANTLDLAGIALIGLLGSIALEIEISIPLLGPIATNNQSLVVVLLIIVLLFTSKSLLGVLLAKATYGALARIESQHSASLIREMLAADPDDLKEGSKGEIEWATLRSTQIAFTVVLGKAIELIAETCLALSILFLLVLTDWPSALIATVYFSSILLAFYLYTRHVLTSAGSAYGKSSVGFSDELSDIIHSFKEISVAQVMPYFTNRLSEMREDVSASNAKNAYLAAIPRLIVETGLILGALIFLGFHVVSSTGSADWAELGVFLFASLRMMSALLPIQRAISSLRYDNELASAAQSLIEKYALQTTFDRTPDPRQNSRFAPVDFSSVPSGGLGIAVDQVNFSYPNASVHSVRNVTLAIEPGMSVAFIGPSGAGKSTLLELIVGLREPDSGCVLIGGSSPRDFRNSNPGSIAIVPQKPGLVRGSIAENVALGVPRGLIDENRVHEVLVQANLHDFILAMPAGINSALDKHLDSLSGGQAQRLGLARSLYTRPRLLALDEPTSALDPETEHVVAQNLERLKHSTTTITVAHRLSTVKTADCVYVIDAGEIVARGSFEKLIAQNDRVRSYVAFLGLG